MAEEPREHVVLAELREVSARPELLWDWIESVDGSAPVTLVLVATDAEVEQAEMEASMLLAAAGMDEGPQSPHILLVAGNRARDEPSLALKAEAIYGEARIDPSLEGLPHVDAAWVRDRFGAPVALPEPVLLTPAAANRFGDATSPASELAHRLSDDLWIWHRDTHEDREVIRQAFEEQQYSTQRLRDTAWPDVDTWGTRAGRDAVPLIVDCGANIGAASVYFKLRYPESRVVAIEPEPGNFALLVRNASQLEDVVPLECAVASKPGKVRLTDPGIGDWGFRAGAGLDKGALLGEVEAITIDDALAAGGDAVPFILKVDIEGAELDLFSDRTETLSRFPVVMIELHDWMLAAEETSRSFLRWHLAENRDLVGLGETLISVSPVLRRA